MKHSIRTLAMLGLAAGLAIASTARADEADNAGGKDNQDQIEELRTTLGTMSAQINSMQGILNMIQVHGFAEFDAFNDTTGSFQEVVGNGAVKLYEPVAGAFTNDNGQTQESVRNSRFDFLAQNKIGDWKAKGYLELDLLGYDPAPLYGAPAAANTTVSAGPPAKGTTAASNTAASASEAGFYTNATVRVRHAYTDAQNGGWDIMAGQYWTLLGWNMDYTLATVSVAPVMGVIYQRTPQLRLGYTFMNNSDFKIQTAVDAERPTEREADQPNYSQGVRFIYAGWNGNFAGATGPSKSVPLSLGISGTEREFKYYQVATPTNSEYDYAVWGQALAVDALVPVIPFDGKDSMSLVLTGEWSAGSGYGDEFPSWSGGASALSAATGNPDLDSGLGMLDARNGLYGKTPVFTLVQDQTWNAQVQFHLPPSIGTFFTFGYGQIHSPNVDDLLNYGNGGAVGKIYDTDSAVFANIMQDFGTTVRVALEFDSFSTHYAGNLAAAPTVVGGVTVGTDGVWARDNRLQLSTYYRF